MNLKASVFVTSAQRPWWQSCAICVHKRKTMPKVMRIVSRVDGWTGHNGKYVAQYDPTVHLPDGGYDGGLLVLTDNPHKALQFPDAGAAMQKWMQPAGGACHGKRPGG